MTAGDPCQEFARSKGLPADKFVGTGGISGGTRGGSTGSTGSTGKYSCILNGCPC